MCANSSLSLQQKREQIHEIRQREKQQLEGLITPQQQQEVQACRKERGMGGHGGGGGRGAGPCGEIATPRHQQPSPNPKQSEAESSQQN